MFSSLGRRHFLHVYVRPPQQAATAVDLWNAWQQFHKHLDWEDLRHVLVDELEQTDLARFQRYVMDKIEEISQTKRFPDENADVGMEPNPGINERYCVSLVADQMHLLFPIECACDGTSLGFQTLQTRSPETLIEGHPWSQLKLVASVLDRDLGCLDCRGDIATRHDDCKYSQANGSTALVVWNEKTFLNPTPVQKVIAEGRRQRLIAQQLDFCRVMWKSHRGTRQVTLTKNENAWDAAKGILVGKREALLSALAAGGSTYAQRFAQPEVTELLGGLSCEAFFKPFFYLESIDPIDDNAWQRAYREIVGGSLHKTLSEYIETGFIHWLLHLDQETKAYDVSTMQSSYDQMWSRMMSSIPNNNWLGSLRSQLGRCDTEIRKLLKRCAESNNQGVTQQWIEKYCSTETTALRVLRDTYFRFETLPALPSDSAAKKLSTYLKLRLSDSCFSQESVRVNLAKAAFGVGRLLQVHRAVGVLLNYEQTFVQLVSAAVAY